MTREEFDAVRGEFETRCYETMASKRPVYTNGSEDVLANFRSVATRLQMDSKKALAVYLIKHLDSVLTYINGGYTDPESIDTRLQDLHNYTVLLYALIHEGSTGARRA